MRSTSAYTEEGDLAMGHLQADIDHAAGGVGPGQAARGGPHGLEFCRLHHYLGQLSGERGRVSLGLWQKDGSALLRQLFGIAGVVIVDRVGHRHQ